MGGTTGSWAALIGLGAFHGINPGMGWLFAVALGLQERRRGAVLSALLPLGIGHALAVAAAIAVAVLAGAVMPLQWVRWVVAAILILFGISRLLGVRALTAIYREKFPPDASRVPLLGLFDDSVISIQHLRIAPFPLRVVDSAVKPLQLELKE